MAGWYRAFSGGVELFVRLTPRSGGDELGAVEHTADGHSHLCARVRAVPEKGAANAALERLVAGELDIARSRVRIAAGQSARLKTVRIEGDSTALAARLDVIADLGR